MRFPFVRVYKYDDDYEAEDREVYFANILECDAIEFGRDGGAILYYDSDKHKYGTLYGVYDVFEDDVEKLEEYVTGE